MKPLQTLASALAILATLASCPGAALGQGAYPSKPVTLVVPFTSGGPNDEEFRLFLPRIQESMKQSFVFDFKPGATSTIGTGYVAKAAPDGYTLLITNGSITIHPNFYPDLPYDVPGSFEPITQMTERYTILISSVAGLPEVRSIPDLVSWGKAHPGQLNCGAAGAGGVSHIACVALASATGVPITPIQYKGVSQGLIDVIAGRTQLTLGTIFVALPGIKAGKLRAIAALNARSKIFPELPTAMELGLDVEYPTWLGVFAPARTPAAIVNKLNAELAAAAHAPEVVSRVESQGSFIVASSPETFRKKLVTERARWKKIITEKGIKLEE
jgi:tripartite-type tricarboxylate transporter receptor subunit TctC